MKCVITADIVKSTHIAPEYQNQISIILNKIHLDTQHFCKSRFEMYRGDSFQVLIDDARKGMLYAIAIRAGLMYMPPKNEKWDARISLGIGNVEIENERVTMSDGEAFRISGRAFEKIGKRRLIATTINEDINQELALTCAFADNVITNWSKRQAEMMYKILIKKTTRQYLATSNGTSPQNIGKILKSAKENLIQMFINRYYQLINNL